MRRTLLGAAVGIWLLSIGACTDGPLEPGGNPVTLNWAPCINDVDIPSWFAVQDGDGAWTRVTPANGVFAFSVSSGRAGVATYANGELTIVYATTTELDTFKPSCTGSRRSISGTVTGYVTLDDIDVEMDQGSAGFSGTTPAPSSFQLSNVAPGAIDVLATKSRSSVSLSAVQVTPSAVFIRRAQSTSPLAAIDLNSTVESGAPLLRTATVSNAANNETVVAATALFTPTSAISMSLYSTSLSVVTGNIAAVFYGLPAARLSSGDTQELIVISTKSISGSSSEARLVATTYTDVTDKAITLGPALGTVTITGSARPSAAYTIQTGYDRIFQLDLDQGSGVSSKSIRLITTKGYLDASATAVTLVVPDLTGVAGFSPLWQLTTGSSATWTFYAGSDALGTFAGNAQSLSAATRNATFTP